MLNGIGNSGLRPILTNGDQLPGANSTSGANPEPAVNQPGNQNDGFDVVEFTGTNDKPNNDNDNDPSVTMTTQAWPGMKSIFKSIGNAFKFIGNKIGGAADKVRDSIVDAANWFWNGSDKSKDDESLAGPIYRC